MKDFCKWAGKLIRAALLAFSCLLIMVGTGYMMGYKPYVVLSGSMEPVISTGSVAWINENVAYDDINKGDIIAFKNQDVQVIHRAISITEDGIETKGDNNDVSDGISTTKANYTGRYMTHVPKAGYILYSKKNRIFLIIGFVFLYMLSLFLDLFANEKSTDKKE